MADAGAESVLHSRACFGGNVPGRCTLNDGHRWVNRKRKIGADLSPARAGGCPPKPSATRNADLEWRPSLRQLHIKRPPATRATTRRATPPDYPVTKVIPVLCSGLYNGYSTFDDVIWRNRP